MSFTYVLHARPLRICIRTPSSAPIDRSPGGFWDSAKLWVRFSMLNDRLKCNKICGIFEEMMMTMNPTLMNSPCSCLSVYQPCRGPQTDVSGPEPCTFRVGTSSTVGHSISGPGPNQCDPMPTRRRQTVDKQSGPHSSQLRSTSPTSAGAQLGSAVRQHDYDGVPVQSTYFHNSKLPATLISFYIAGETILEVPHPMFSQLFVHSCRSQFFLHFFGREHGHPDRYWLDSGLHVDVKTFSQRSSWFAQQTEECFGIEPHSGVSTAIHSEWSIFSNGWIYSEKSADNNFWIFCNLSATDIESTNWNDNTFASIMRAP